MTVKEEEKFTEWISLLSSLFSRDGMYSSLISHSNSAFWCSVSLERRYLEDDACVTFCAAFLPTDKCRWTIYVISKALFSRINNTNNMTWWQVMRCVLYVSKASSTSKRCTDCLASLKVRHITSTRTVWTSGRRNRWAVLSVGSYLRFVARWSISCRPMYPVFDYY